MIGVVIGVGIDSGWSPIGKLPWVLVRRQMLGSWVSLALLVTIFTLGIGMCEESVGDSGYGHGKHFHA